MNIVTTLPQTEADFFNEKPPIQTGSMFVLRKIQDPNNAILLSEDGIEIQPNTSTSVSESDPDPVPAPDFPFQEFLLTEVINQSQMDYSSISDMAVSRKNSNSSRKATKSTDLTLESSLNYRSHEELGENRDSTVSDKHIKSSRDYNTISIPDNSNPGKSIPGNMTPSAPNITGTPEEIQMPTDIQALMVLQDLISDDFQAMNTPSTRRKRENTHSTQRKGEDTHPDTHSTQRKGENTEDETFQLIQKIHNQLQQVQWNLQRLHSLHKYKV